MSEWRQQSIATGLPAAAGRGHALIDGGAIIFPLRAVAGWLVCWCCGGGGVVVVGW